jgi:hypothetical protein
MPADAVDLTDLTGDDVPAAAAAAAAVGGAARGGNVIDLLDSDSDSEENQAESPPPPRFVAGLSAWLASESDLRQASLRSARSSHPEEDRRPRKRPAPASGPAAGRRPQQAPKKTRGVIDLSGDAMKVTVELGQGAAAAPRAAASVSGGTSQSGGSGNRGEEDMWKCSICLDEMVNPASTTCGHIFCEECIKQCIKTAKKCPQCRKRLTAKSAYHRIYLPSSKPNGGGPPDDAFPAR